MACSALQRWLVSLRWRIHGTRLTRHRDLRQVRGVNAAPHAAVASVASVGSLAYGLPARICQALSKDPSSPSGPTLTVSAEREGRQGGQVSGDKGVRRWWLPRAKRSKDTHKDQKRLLRIVESSTWPRSVRRRILLEATGPVAGFRV